VEGGATDPVFRFLDFAIFAALLFPKKLCAFCGRRKAPELDIVVRAERLASLSCGAFLTVCGLTFNSTSTLQHHKRLDPPQEDERQRDAVGREQSQQHADIEERLLDSDFFNSLLIRSPK